MNASESFMQLLSDELVGHGLRPCHRDGLKPVPYLPDYRSHAGASVCREVRFSRASLPSRYRRPRASTFWPLRVSGLYGAALTNWNVCVPSGLLPAARRPVGVGSSSLVTTGSLVLASVQALFAPGSRQPTTCT